MNMKVSCDIVGPSETEEINVSIRGYKYYLSSAPRALNHVEGYASFYTPESDRSVIEFSGDLTRSHE